jgi:2-iminobutanoate/2-iminopropanoate deaminase
VLVNLRFTHLNRLITQEGNSISLLRCNSKQDKKYGNQQGGQIPWNVREKEYGYSQAVKVDNTIYVSGQVSHDDKGNIVGRGDMQVQMRQAYANIEKVLAQYGATIDNIVDEVPFVTDMEAAFAARVKCQQEVFSGNPVLASTIVQIKRLAFPELMVEMRCICRV